LEVNTVKVLRDTDVKKLSFKEAIDISSQLFDLHCVPYCTRILGKSESTHRQWRV